MPFLLNFLETSERRRPLRPLEWSEFGLSGELYVKMWDVE